MRRSRNQSTIALFGAAFIAVSMLASPSFANIGGGNADDIPLVSNGYLAGSAQARLPVATPSAAVNNSTACHDGYRWTSRDPHPYNGDRQAYSIPMPCN